MGEFESSSLIDTSLIRGSLYRTLKAIRKKGPLSKAEVARETGLSNPAAISAVDSLKEIGLIVEVGSRNSAWEASFAMVAQSIIRNCRSN